jgi:hypothetical protein
VTFTLRDATFCSSSDCTIFKDAQIVAFVLKLEGVGKVHGGPWQSTVPELARKSTQGIDE